MNALAGTILPSSARPDAHTAFGCPRDFLENRYVYAMVSPRARGLSIGVNLNPDQRCNFDCVYCEVPRRSSPGSALIDLDVLGRELEETVRQVESGALQKRAPFRELPPELLALRHVALSGDGEPTLAPQFRDVVETLVHLRAIGRIRFCKFVLITNATNLNAPAVFEGIRLLTRHDEVWAKLDAGTQAHMDCMNGAHLPIETVLEQILRLGRERDIVIQSLFARINGTAPGLAEIEAFATRLKHLAHGGAKIASVQIYSATRPAARGQVEHLPLQSLSEIARTVRRVAGMHAEVF